MSSRWTEPENDPRVQGDPVGELATYREYLDYYRLTIELKCEDLDSEQLARRSVPPSTLSLLGLVRHLAKVEHSWFHRVLQGNLETPRLYHSDDEPDRDFDGAVADQQGVLEAFATWKSQIEAANVWLDGLKEVELGNDVLIGEDSGSIRDILVHMVEEYARHAGHADLLRECIDGRTGQ